MLLLPWASGLTFFQDEWAVVLHRRGLTADAYLVPHNEHLIFLPVAIYKGLLAVFTFLRRRLGGWLA